MELKELLKMTLGDQYKEDMTDDEIKTAISAKSKAEEKPAMDDKEKTHLKSLISKANSEAAKYKKELQAHLTDEEKAKAEREEQVNAMKEELESLRKTNAISAQKASLISLGYDSELAEAQASAMVEGDMAKVTELQKKFMEIHDKQVLAKNASSTKRPTTGGTAPSEKPWKDMTIDERTKLKRDDPARYAELRAKH